MKAVSSFVRYHRRLGQHRLVSSFAKEGICQQSSCGPLPKYANYAHHKVSSSSMHRTLNTKLCSTTAVSEEKTEIRTDEDVVSQTDKDMIAETPLFKSAPHLLDGLDTYIVKSEDGHPLSLYGINSNLGQEETSDEPKRRPILLLHGRTWSSVPVYHLLGGSNSNQSESHHSRSLMESMYEAGLQPYAMDFRGFGGTPRDETNSVIPNQCVMDTECVLKYIAKKHGCSKAAHHSLPALMGWSQGALVAQLLAQKSPQMISKLVLYGSIYDPLVRYPRQPLFINGTDGGDVDGTRIKNEFNGAIEDFTVEGSIPPAAAIEFAEAALASDPIKAPWNFLSQFNNCDPARVNIPTLVVAGDQDPYAPLRVQSELFSNLGRGADRTWSIIADADHAVHLLDGGKERLLSIVTSFIENGKKGESTEYDV
jgi:pimeloyl-ACP methyl ester carboxylesterase